MIRKRVQISELDRGKICRLATEHWRLTGQADCMVQAQLDKPNLAQFPVTLKDCTNGLLYVLR